MFFFKLKRSSWAGVIIAVAFFLFIMATLWYSRALLTQMEIDERNRIRTWAAATQRRAEMVEYIRCFFAKLEVEERKYATVWAHSYQRLLSATNDVSDYDYYFNVVAQNENIPFVLVDPNNRIIDFRDPGIPPHTKYLHGNLQMAYNAIPPIVMDVNGEEYKFYYKASSLFEEVRQMLSGLTSAFIQEIVANTISVPIIITDQSQKNVLHYGNIKDELFSDEYKVERLLSDMEQKNPPIAFMALADQKCYIFYEPSDFLKQVKYFPLALIVSFIILGLVLIYVYRISEKAEKDQLLLSMSKETAHQLGTPISSLMAWAEYYKHNREAVGLDDIVEIEKDLYRLQTITNRFSKIGSQPELKVENIVAVVYRAANYLQARISKKISFKMNVPINRVLLVYLNAYLFEWVIENLCKNAADAIGDHEGEVNIVIQEENKCISLEIHDTGKKGIPKHLQNTIFDTGYTTKRRGWGLGLSLCKRIVEDYHSGKIFVKSSSAENGTVFRVQLPKKEE